MKRILLFILLLIISTSVASAVQVNSGVTFQTENTGVSYYIATRFNCTNITVYSTALNINGGNITTYSNINMSMESLTNTTHLKFTNNATITNLTITNNFANFSIFNGNIYELYYQVNDTQYDSVTATNQIVFNSIPVGSWYINGLPPTIITWSNNKTLNTSQDITINITESIEFNATANQTVTTWNWYKDGILDTVNKVYNITLSWFTGGSKTVEVNATNDYGTSNTILWNVTVNIQSPQNLTTISYQTSVDIDWDDYASADKYSIYEMEDGFSYVNTNPTIDGIKDSIYDSAHEFLIFAPNPVNTSDYETIYPLRTSLGAYFFIESVDNDVKLGDDDCIYYFDLDNDGLTIDDPAWKITNNIVKKYLWDGASWKVTGVSSAIGASTGGGTHYPIHELFIPVAELGGNWTNGSMIKVLVKREDSSLTPDVITWYPFGNINDSDTSLWQEMVLNQPNTYNLLANVTLSNYTALNLTLFTIYHGAVSTWNGTDESDYILFDVITEDTPIYNASGYILDTDGNGIPNATVYSCNGYVREITTTNASGYWAGYKFYNDTYTICANATGYHENSTSITIAGVDLTNVNLTLEYSQYFPPTPTNLTYSTYNFGINYSFIEGIGVNNTDSYNITFNGTQYNGVTDLFFNESVGVHGYGNITVYAYNNTNDGALSAGFVTNNITINNPISITNTSDANVNEGSNVYVDFDRIDLDGDTPIFSCNRTDLFTDFDTATGTGNWQTDYDDAGTYYVDFGVSDGYGSTSNDSMNIVVLDVEEEIIPPSRDSSGISSKSSSGGIGASGEDLDNILYKESSMIYYAQYNKIVKANFDNYNLHNIKSITYIPTKNAQNIGITVEKLKTKSIYAKTSSPHILYSNVNIWVGQLDYSNNLKDAQIEFTVPREWIIQNAVTKISLMHYNLDNNKWEKLPTKMTKVSSSTYTYIAITQSFSPFTIVGESISTTPLMPLSEKIINILPENIQKPINEIISDNEKISSSVHNADSNLNLIGAKIKSLILSSTESISKFIKFIETNIMDNKEIIISLILIIIISLLFTVITAIDSTLIHILLTVALMGLIYLITQDFYPLEHYIVENISSDLLNKIKYTRGLLSTLIYLLITIIPAQYIKEKIDK